MNVHQIMDLVYVSKTVPIHLAHITVAAILVTPLQSITNIAMVRTYLRVLTFLMMFVINRYQ